MTKSDFRVLPPTCLSSIIPWLGKVVLSVFWSQKSWSYLSIFLSSVCPSVCPFVHLSWLLYWCNGHTCWLGALLLLSPRYKTTLIPLLDFLTHLSFHLLLAPSLPRRRGELTWLWIRPDYLQAKPANHFLPWIELGPNPYVVYGGTRSEPTCFYCTSCLLAPGMFWIS